MRKLTLLDLQHILGGNSAALNQMQRMGPEGASARIVNWVCLDTGPVNLVALDTGPVNLARR